MSPRTWSEDQNDSDAFDLPLAAALASKPVTTHIITIFPV